MFHRSGQQTGNILQDAILYVYLFFEFKTAAVV